LTRNRSEECAFEYFNNDFKVLYNNQSTKHKNNFIPQNFVNTDICGPVIIELNVHKTLDQKVWNTVDWIGFNYK
jgi:hypothetical protein